MERRIRRLGIFMLLCFVALFIQLNNIQIFKANSLATNQNNPRVLNVERSQTRGSILSDDGTVLAESVPAPAGSVYKYQRVYPANTASLFAQVIGFDSSIYGNYRGIEAEYNSYLTPHTPPARTLRDLLTNRTEVDNVTLTMNENLQLQVAQALDTGTAKGVNGAAAVVLNAQTGAVMAMYSNPSYDPNPLVSQNPQTQKFAWDSYLAESGQPLVSGTYGQTTAPGSSFKVITTSAVLEHAPLLAVATYPVVGSVTLPDTGTKPQMLTNYHNGTCGGNLEALVIQSCDADFAEIGLKLGGTTLLQQAEAYGFNQVIPLDVPSDTVAPSTMEAPGESDADFVSDIPGVMKSAIGQENVSASALQMAMVAGAVANGGSEMTPHIMAYIDNSQGGRVTTYQPKQWLQPISAQTAATLTTYMLGVTHSSTPLGTAYGVFPASWDVAAKTGTAQTGAFGPNPPFTNDWLISFAPVGNTKVAIAVVLPNQPGDATGAKYSGPIVRQILGDVRADAGLSGSAYP
jgi:peptidoglycan glycosyltransferase